MDNELGWDTLSDRRGIVQKTALVNHWDRGRPPARVECHSLKIAVSIIVE